MKLTRELAQKYPETKISIRRTNDRTSIYSVIITYETRAIHFEIKSTEDSTMSEIRVFLDVCSKQQRLILIS